jgi:hypothetical protein
MKRKFKQWWLTIPTISTKWRIASHLNSLNTKKTMTDDVVNPGPGLGQAQKVVELNRLMGHPQLLIWTVMITKSTITSPLNVHKNIQVVKQTQENFEDTKRIIISQKSKDRQYNGQKKKDKQCLTFRK